jgi:hypothetical protein
VLMASLMQENQTSTVLLQVVMYSVDHSHRRSLLD